MHMLLGKGIFFGRLDVENADHVMLFDFYRDVQLAQRLGMPIIKASCDRLLEKLQIKDPIFEIAQELETAALSDPYFIERKLYPNVDLYSGIILRALGFPMSMFTVLFAVARTVGWIAQSKEMIEDPSQRIGRPRQLYTGASRRDYVPMSKRGK